MNPVLNFRILDTIGKSEASWLAHTFREQDNHPTILKILKEERATTERQNRYRQESFPTNLGKTNHK